ncbi:MAG TPA: chemotaxis protein CheW [Cycloclasticus sp.]|jgi:purine-binding chemotaxis protein CheW|nr:chemotaxis protein CheW [Cycloclasticus sp.]HIL92444.1 chemotaxis protein CheW [Cycloclasticus sp.]
MSSEREEYEDADAVEPVTQWLTFLLGNEKYAVKVVQVQEVLRYTPITPVPGATMEVLGIINLRGNVVTVVALRKKFNMPSIEVDDSTRIMMMDIQGYIIGVLVDTVTEVIDLNDSEIESAPDVSSSGNSVFIQGIAQVENELHILVNLGKLLSQKDLELLAK